MRTLKLLEQEHLRLSEILKFASESPVAPLSKAESSEVSSEKAVQPSAAVAELRTSKSERRTPSTNAPTYRKPPSRELSSSIASNLASARGIRSSNPRRPLSPSVYTQQVTGNIEPSRNNARQVKREQSTVDQVPALGKPSWVPPMQSATKSEAHTATSPAAATAAAKPAEDGFTTWYNTVESLLSKLSAPLAYAGIPLTAEETPDTATQENSQKQRPTASKTISTDSDLTKYFSRAALRAASRSENPGGDSFYVVPSTGGTVSYAGIMKYEAKEHRRLQQSMHSENPDLFEEDEFVDALDVQVKDTYSKSPTAQKLLSSSRTHKDRIIEELYYTNKELKEATNNMSKRLRAFEMGSQRSAMALQESMRFSCPTSPIIPASDNPKLAARIKELEDQMTQYHADITRGGDSALVTRIKLLEEQSIRDRRKMEEIAAKNRDLKIILTKYRERWDNLKKMKKGEVSSAASPEPGERSKTKIEEGVKKGDVGSGRFLAG